MAAALHRTGVQEELFNPADWPQERPTPLISILLPVSVWCAHRLVISDEIFLNDTGSAVGLKSRANALVFENNRKHYG
jgi:hypothetical protein